MDPNLNNYEKPLGIEIIRIILKNIRIIIILVGVAVLCSLIITMPFIMPPVYKSETIIYPPATNTSLALLNSDMKFGSEIEINEELQILHSTVLRDSIVKKYHLFNHYKIDTTSAKKNYYLNKEYYENIKADESRYNSVVVNVYDENPEMAANIANDLIKMGDKVKSEIIKKNLKGAFDYVSREFGHKVKELSDLGDSITSRMHRNYRLAIDLKNNHFLNQKGRVDELRSSLGKIRTEQGVNDIDNQFNTIYKSYMKANAQFLIDSGMVSVMKKHYKENDTALVKKEAELEGSKILTDRLRKKLDNLNVASKKYTSLFDSYDFEKSILGELKSEYEISSSDYEKEYNDVTLETLKNKYSAEQVLYNNLKAKYELALSNLSDQVPAAYVVNPAEIPVKKNSPNRLIITILAAIGVFLATILYFMLENYFSKFSENLKS